LHMVHQGHGSTAIYGKQQSYSDAMGNTKQ